MKSRGYKVIEIATGKVRIIEATSVAHAMKHVAETTHTCVVCNGIEAVKLISDGVKFESAMKKSALANERFKDIATSTAREVFKPAEPAHTGITGSARLFDRLVDLARQMTEAELSDLCIHAAHILESRRAAA